MNKQILMASIAAGFFSTSAMALDVSFADKQWNNTKVPAGQQCQKFGGKNPGTPALSVSDIPAGADALVMAFSDRDSPAMNNGGHGVLSFSLSPASSETDIPSVPGHTFEVPAKFKSLEAHRGPNWDKAGAYMPPCSGGKDHAYYVTVKAVNGDKVLSETVLEMGKY